MTACATTTDLSATIKSAFASPVEPKSVPVSEARFCVVYTPRTWSVHDTDQTIRERKEDNAKYKAICKK